MKKALRAALAALADERVPAELGTQYRRVGDAVRKLREHAPPFFDAIEVAQRVRLHA